MENIPRDRPLSIPARDELRHPHYPLHKIIAAIAPAEMDEAVAALVEAGFARDRIETIAAEDVSGLDEPVGGPGLRGLLTRLSLSMGDNLDEIEQARRELLYGHALILVLVQDDEERNHANAILRQHKGHAMHYFGQWTISTLEGDAE